MKKDENRKKKRKSVRVPVELYKKLTQDLSKGNKSSTLNNIILEYGEKVKNDGVEIIKKHGELDSSPIKISGEAFYILKVLKFQTDLSYTNIIASAIEYYLEKGEEDGE